MKKTNAGVQSRKQRSHERIVEVTSKAIRRSGYDGTGIADIMREAGLTHGGFYSHFPSREALLAEAADCAGAETIAKISDLLTKVPAQQALGLLVQEYLSTEHLKDIESGCHIAALASEMPRQATEVRQASTRRIKEMVDLIARLSPHWGGSQAHKDALFSISTLVGTLILARAVDDPKLAQEFLDVSLQKLTQT